MNLISTPLIRWRPLLKAAFTSCTVMAAGDVLCQSIRALNAGREPCIDTRQTSRFALVGATLHGPFFYTGFRWLDTILAPPAGMAPTFRLAVTKTILGQVTMFPIYLVAFFSYMGLLEGLTPSECVVKVKKAVPTSFLYGSSWILINIVNFRFVKPEMRVAYVNAAGLFWNAWLSFENSTEAHVEHREQQTGVVGNGGRESNETNSSSSRRRRRSNE